MLREERITKMSKMAMFEKGKNKACLQISSYYKKDYIALQTIMTLLWTTVGYCIIVAGALALKMEEVLYDITMEWIKELAVTLGGSYLVVLVVAGGIAILYYGWKYQMALNVAKEYYKALGTLSADYKKEN